MQDKCSKRDLTETYSIAHDYPSSQNADPATPPTASEGPTDGGAEWLSYWQAECERAILYTTNLLRVAERDVTVSAALEMLRSAPRTREEFTDEDQSRLIFRCVADAMLLDRKKNPHLREAIDWFKGLANRQSSGRALLEASLAGALQGWGMGASPMRFRCLNCRKKLKGQYDWREHKVKCALCQFVWRLPVIKSLLRLVTFRSRN
jgi:hypothetical protein